MTARSDFSSIVSEWLVEEAGSGAPDYLDDILQRTAGSRQRPAWTSLERLIPVDLTVRPLALSSRLPWRLMAVAMVALLIAALLAVYVGSHRAPAPPFGPARNGAVVYGQGGDIFRVDPATGASTALITGPANDGAPYFSRDGQSIVFLRATSSSDAIVAVANADGSSVRELTPPLTDQNWFDWSPDGRRLALISTVAGVRTLTIANVDGSGTKALALAVEPEFATWRGPEGAELIFRGSSNGTVGIYAVKPDGTGLRRISPSLGEDALYQYPIASPDGTRVAYHSFEQTDQGTAGASQPSFAWDGKLIRIHVLNLLTSQDVVIPSSRDPLDSTLPVDESAAVFSPDGQMIAFLRDRSDGGAELAFAAADGTGTSRQIGPTVPQGSDQGMQFEFTPDGTAIVATYPHQGVARILPIDGSASTVLPFSGTELPSMQRLAP